MEKRSVQHLALGSIIALLCLPRLGMGFGLDEDAWTGARAAENFFRTGHYWHSRLPGNPLFEYLLAPIVPLLGELGTNLFVFMSYLVCVVLFALQVREREQGRLLTFLFALTPVLLVSGVTTMDYLPGLALMMGAWACMTRGRVLSAALLLGLAIGFRLSNVLFVVPLAGYMFASRERLKRIILMASLSVVVGGVFYLPIFQNVGWRMFKVPPSVLPLKVILFRTVYNGIQLFGPLATVAIVAVLALNARGIVLSLRRGLEERSPAFLLELSTVLLFSLLYLSHSDETTYLIPVVPFVYLLLARWVPRRQLLWVAVLVMSYAFFSIDFKGGESGRRQLTFRPTWGAVVKDFRERIELEHLRQGLSRFPGPDRSVILTGMAAALTYRNPLVTPATAKELSPLLEHEVPDMARLAGRSIYLAYDLSLEDVRQLTAEGYTFYVFSALAPTIALNKHGYDPYQVARRLDVFNEQAFYK